MNNPRFRPPAEARSVILQIDEGCPHNACTFCGMYKQQRFRRRPWIEIEAVLRSEAEANPAADRVFLADGDVMARSFEDLSKILNLLKTCFPRLARVALYASGSSILSKSADELAQLRTGGLHTLYMGLESGDDELLARCLKRDTVDVMVEAGRRAQGSGLRMSVMVLLGLGGRDGSERHAQRTAEALNRMQPRLLSTLRVVPVQGTPLGHDAASGRFQMLTEVEIVGELRNLLQALDLRATVFRADHASNVVSLQGRLPVQRESLLAQLDLWLRSSRLDRNSPGVLPRWL